MSATQIVLPSSLAARELEEERPRHLALGLTSILIASQRPAGDHVCPKDASYDEPSRASIRQPGFRGSSKISGRSTSPAESGISADRRFLTILEIHAAKVLPTKARRMTSLY